MKFVIIVSNKDLAGLNIKANLVNHFGFKEIEEEFQGFPVHSNGKTKLYTLSGDSVFSEDLHEFIKADFFIFATRHSSKKEIPTLTVHPIGNWGKAEIGGKTNTLVKTNAVIMKKALQLLDETNNLEEFAVAQEATHHGPYTTTPTLFIEIGSTETQWVNQNAGRIIAKVIVKLIDDPILENQISVIGVGGLHIHEQFEKVRRTTNYAFGHVCPKYNLENFDENILIQALNTCNAELIIYDHKSMGQEKNRILELLKNKNVKFKKYSDLN